MKTSSISITLSLALLLLSARPALSQQPMTAGITEVLRIQGPFPGNNIGLQIFDAGDIDGDGIDDIVSASAFDTCPDPTIGLCGGFHGAIRAFSGFDGHEIWNTLGDFDEQFAYHTDKIKDVNGDGIADYAAINFPVCYGKCEDPDHQVGVISGADGTILQWTDARHLLPGFSRRIWSVGDVNANGTGDYCLGHGFFLKIFDGGTGALIRAHGDPLFYTGSIAGCLDDIDGDGFDDYFMGADALPPGPGISKLLVFSGRDGHLIRELPGIGVVDNASSGFLTEDIDSGGTPDLIIGATSSPCAGGTITSCGHVRAYSLETGSVIWHVSGSFGLEWYGLNVSGITDFNNDGWKDVLVKPAGGGSARILSGIDGQVLHTFPPAVHSTSQAVGDLTGDGIPEFAISNIAAPSFSWRGEIVIYSPVPVPAAHTATGVPGCAAAGPEPRLLISAPLLGHPVTVDLTFAPPGIGGVLYASGVPVAPLNLGGGCLLDLDPASYFPIDTIPPTASGLWSGQYLLPPIPTCGGSTVSVQAVFFPSPSPSGVDLSESVHLQLGF